MGELKKLEGVLKESLFKSTKELLESYAYFKCDFLCMNFNAWEKLFARIARSLHKKIISLDYYNGELVARVNRAVGNFIKQKLYEDKTYLLDNLLIKLEKAGYKKERLLAMFLLELKCFNVEFTEYFFDLLKRNSQRFNSIIRMSGFKDLSYEEFVSILNKNHKLDIEIIKDSEIDYNRLIYKYSNMSFEQIRDLFGDDFYEFSCSSRNLLERYFVRSNTRNLINVYDVEKEVSLSLANYKRKNTNLGMTKLREVYLANKDRFSQKQALYLECFVLGLKDKGEFIKAYPDTRRIAKFSLISKLEKLYYGIDDLFDTSLSKDQYLEVLNAYPLEASKYRSDILNYYYGINCNPHSIKEISRIFDVSYDEMKEVIRNCRCYCLSLYCNINTSNNIDKKLYIPYVLDERCNLNPDGRKALKLFLIDNKSYEEISKEVKGKIPNIISVGLQKIDEYRFGISCLNTNMESTTIEVSEADILEEINRHQSESVISVLDKKFLSYFLGLKTPYNVTGEKLKGSLLQEKLGAKSRVKVQPKYDDLISKIQQRKLGVLKPELFFIPREELAGILDDCHLPISDEERYIICSLLEIKGQTLKTLEELARELGVTSKSIKRKYKLAIVNIKKYMIGEKEGIINYEYDIVPVLKYFTFKERELLYDYYVSKLMYKDIANKYDISLSKVKRIMYRIKTYLIDIIKNPLVVRFDYDYYHQVVNKSDFPYRGNLEQAKRIFDLYVGETTFGRANIEEIKNILGLNITKEAIARIIDGLVLGVFKYKDGIKKENAFSIEEVKEFYLQYKNSLSSVQLQMFANLFNKNMYADYKMSSDLIFLMMKGKNFDCFDISKSSKDDILRLLRDPAYKFTKKIRNTLMHYGNISDRELMSGSEINHVFRLLNVLDRKLAMQDSVNRARKIS